LQPKTSPTERCVSHCKKKQLLNVRKWSFICVPNLHWPFWHWHNMEWLLQRRPQAIGEVIKILAVGKSASLPDQVKNLVQGGQIDCQRRSMILTRVAILVDILDHRYHAPLSCSFWKRKTGSLACKETREASLTAIVRVRDVAGAFSR